MTRLHQIGMRPIEADARRIPTLIRADSSFEADLPRPPERVAVAAAHVITHLFHHRSSPFLRHFAWNFHL
jgi:hypothetical protein